MSRTPAITLEQAATAFEAWESNYRAEPSRYLTQEQISALGVSQVSADRAAYFCKLLADTRRPKPESSLYVKGETIFGTEPSPPVLKALTTFGDSPMDIAMSSVIDQSDDKVFKETLQDLKNNRAPIPEGVSVFHGLTQDYTVAYGLQDNGEGGLYVTAGIAYCSKKDHFSRFMGRAYAIARLLCFNPDGKKKLSFWAMRPYPTTGDEWRAVEELIRKEANL